MLRVDHIREAVDDVVAAALDGAALGMARLLERRGDPIYQLDAWGRVLATEAADSNDPRYPIAVVGRHLVAADRAAQPGLDRAVAMAVARPPATTLAPLPGRDGRRYFLQVVPVPGRARDVFLAAAAVAVLIDAGGPPLRIRLDAAAIAHALSLTDREADVAPASHRRLDADRYRQAPWNAGGDGARASSEHFREDRHQPTSRARRAPCPAAAVSGRSLYCT